MSKMKLEWQVELVSWIFTAILTTAVLFPILKNVPDFEYLTYNIISIVMFITLIRYIFLLRFVPFKKSAIVKIILIFVTIPVFVLLVDGLSEFQNALDENGTYSMVSHLETPRQLPMSKYIRSEMIFFGVGALISMAILPFRMIVSIWRVINRNTV